VASGVPFLVIGDVSGTGKLDFADTRFVSESYYTKLHPARCPRRGDVLYSVTGSFGIPVLVDTDQPFCVQRHLAIARPAPGCDQKYLHHVLGSHDVFKQAASIATGTAQKTVPLKGLRKIKIPVAPEAEQARIVESLDSYLTRLDAATEGLKRVEANLKRYRASVLKAAVEGHLVPTEAELAKKEKRTYEPASVLLERILKERRHRWEQFELAKLKAKGEIPKNDAWKKKYEEPAAPDTSSLPDLPEGWCWATVDQLSVVLTSGSRDWSRFYGRGTETFVLAQNVKPGRLDLSERQPVDPPPDDPSCRRSQIEQHDLLITIVGVNTGDCCRVPMPLPEHFVCQSVALIRLASPEQSGFVELFLNSPGGRKALDFLAYGQGRPHLGFDDLRTLAVPLAPLAEQQCILPATEAALSTSDAMTTGLSAQRHRLSRLRQSILRWAFEGNLVDQDPNDEPASALLERIRRQRAAAEATSKSARGRRKAAR
jgi:type I restriction enzyme S subunit